MKTKLFTLSGVSLLLVLSAPAATLGVTAGAARNGALFNYTYAFSVTGAGAVDNLFLGSDDLSPLNLAFTLNGTGTANWSWLGNDVPQNYLQFFSTNGGALASGDSLTVKFTSAFAPASTQFAAGLNSSTNAVTNRLAGVLAPSAVPEPAALGMLLIGFAMMIALGIGRELFSRI